MLIPTNHKSREPPKKTLLLLLLPMLTLQLRPLLLLRPLYPSWRQRKRVQTNTRMFHHRTTPLIKQTHTSPAALLPRKR
jgi:hypothetical protein